MSESPKTLEDIKANDWFTRTLRPTLQQVINHRFGVGGITLALIAIVGGALALGSWYEKRERTYFAALEKIEQNYTTFMEKHRTPATSLPGIVADPERSTQIKELTESLQKFRQEHLSSDAGAVASFYLAELFYLDGKYTEAIEAYQGYLQKLPHGTAFRSVVLNSIGYAYEGLGKFTEAAENFLQAAEVADAPNRDEAYMNSARAFERAGALPAAIANYKKVVDEFPTSSSLNLAKSKLSQLADKT